jgi:arylsulfatase A-like enzyme
MNYRILLFSFLGAICTAFAADQPAAKPNILFIVSDDQGAGDLGCLGAKDLATPNLDALAARGLLFTNFYSNAPVCSPSRASLLTGQYPARAGVRSILPLGNKVTGLFRDSPTLAEILSKHGYNTFWCGKWHLGSAPGSRPWERGFQHTFGFLAGCVDNYSHFFYWGKANPSHDLWQGGQEVWRNGEYTADLITAQTVEEIRANGGKPFFGYVAYNAPHYPLNAPQKYMDRFKDLPQERHWMAAMIASVDDGVGQIVDELKKQGALDNTIIFFVSDNGPSRESRNWMDGRDAPYFGGTTGGLRGEKFSLFEGGIRVPAIFSWPAGIPQPRKFTEPAMSMDIVPTILSLAGISFDPAGFDGASLSDAFKNGSKVPDRTLFWEQGGQTAVREGQWKLIINGQALGSQNPPKLFLANLENDRSELKNLAEANSHLAESLREKALKWRTGVEEEWKRRQKQTESLSQDD